MPPIKIKELEKEYLDKFWAYLTLHVSENGDNDHFFQPLSKEQSKLGPEWEEKFKIGRTKRYGEAGWRKLWIAVNEEHQIVGHIDIRSRPELNTEHRVLLGMGVERKFRNQRIGQALLKFVIDFCRDHTQIVWLDLEVLSRNTPAIRIYQKMNFEILSNINDMFRIGKISYDYTSMTLNVDHER